MAEVQHLLLLIMLPAVLGDMYLHNPRGSNNRLNEQSANRRNGNRLFDSQNNNRGGYNVGDETSAASNSQLLQYDMKYFQSHKDYNKLPGKVGRSYLTVEWTNQHGCGGDEDRDPHKVNCNIVLQYMCSDISSDPKKPEGAKEEGVLRNGRVTSTPNYIPPSAQERYERQYKNRKSGSVHDIFGMHESLEFYDKCYVRERNKGLFTADQKLTKDTAIHTRQNPGGTRRGYECPEERDYYPYWHPTPWKDIAIMAVDAKDCRNLRRASFNVKPYNLCVEKNVDTGYKTHSKWNNKADCEKNGGTWTLFYNFLEITGHTTKQTCRQAKYIWGIPHNSTTMTKQCLVPIGAPHCFQAPWSRTNSLGNGKKGEPLRYNWMLPNFPSGKPQRCVLRARYNISTDDYNPFITDSKFNGATKSPVKQNPLIDVGPKVSSLRLAINTAQFGRTFQDRTHVFLLEPRTPAMGTSTIYNLNVRGKRGNIVQTFPAVEYDFMPNKLTLKQNDMVHIQWTGSNTHRNLNPAGDGQAGDAGQGKTGTDRHNMVQIRSPDVSYPLPLEKAYFWGTVWPVWTSGSVAKPKPLDVALSMATAGFFECAATCPLRPGAKNMDADMNNANASYGGMVLKVLVKGEYHFMCSRNNAFTNRSQKGKITVI